MYNNLAMEYYRPYYTDEQKGCVDVYIQSLGPFESHTLKIASEHLKTSFDVLKSGGYKVFCKKWHKIVRLWRTWAMLQIWRNKRKTWRKIIIRYRYEMEEAAATTEEE